MKHEEAAPLIGDHLQGRLEEPLRSAVKDHAASCPECRALDETYDVLADGFQAGSRAPGEVHPGVEDLVDFALRNAPPRGSERETIGGHVEACASCSTEVETVRRSQAEAASGGHSTPRLVPAWAALAAAGLALVLTYPAFLGLVKLPRLREESKTLLAEREAAKAGIEELRGSLRGVEDRLRQFIEWTGSISVPLLAAPVRAGEAEAVLVPVSQGQPFIWLAVDPGIPDRSERAGTYLFQVLGQGAEVPWSMELEPSEVARQMREAGSLGFQIPAGNLPPAAYRLRIARHGPAGDREVLQMPFTVVQRP